MNRYFEKVFLVITGGFLFLVLDRVIDQRTTIQSRVSQMTGLNFAASEHSASVVALDQTPSKGKAMVYRYNGNQVVRLHEFCTWAVKVDCVMLKTQAGPTPLHIHDVKVDIYVSGYIKSKGSWEPEKINLVMAELQKDPEYGFLDLGSHVGIYSITAAKLGRKVLSVDPLIENTQRLCKSIQKGGFTDQMTIVFNPLSDKYSHVSFTTVANNLGATTLNTSLPVNKNHAPCDDVQDHPTVKLDDLIPLVPFKKAVMKLDVEEHEYHAINGGRKFLKEIDVAVIFMEWGRIQKLTDEAQKLILIFLEFGYKAYQPTVNGAKLDTEKFQTWPWEVLWRKSG